jgi:hypothetical protein
VVHGSFADSHRLNEIAEQDICHTTFSPERPSTFVLNR